MEKLLSKIKYIFIFFFSFTVMSIFMTYVDEDVLWNYGFSYAISSGQIPYLDFNMILPPFYSMVMSMGMVFSKNILIFYIENSLIITVMFYFLFKMYKEKAWLFLLFLVFPIPAVVYPTYNLLLIFLLVVIFYLEKNNGNDYLIGLLFGIMVFTKQTVGVAVLLVGLIYYLKKEPKKVVKRLVGFLIPCILFLIYFIATGSLYEFFNHCLFGLFDFTEANAKVNSIFIFSLVMLGIVIVMLFRDRKNIYNWYILAFYIIVVPLFDIDHIAYFLFSLLLVLLNRDFNFNKRIVKYYLFFTCFYVGTFFSVSMLDGFVYPNHYDNFNFRVLYNANNENNVRDEMIEFVNNNKDSQRIVFFGSDAYFYKITCGMDIDHFDLLNKGNHGYKGKEKVKRMIDELESDTIMVIDSIGNASKDSSQFMEDVADYAIQQGEKVDDIYGYSIYKKK